MGEGQAGGAVSAPAVSVPAAEAYRIEAVDKAEVLRYLGYRGQSLAPELDGLVDAAIADCLRVARPRGCVRAFDIAARGLDADGTPFIALRGCALRLEGRDICAHLADAVAVGLLAVTLGVGIDRQLRLLSSTDPTGELAFDAAATACVEQAADAAEARIVGLATGRGLYTSYRYSPGYGDMPLACQPQLLASVNAQRLLGLTLTPTNLLIPTKSVTAVVGMHPAPQPSTHDGCATCGCRPYCTVRRTGRTCHE